VESTSQSPTELLNVESKSHLPVDAATDTSRVIEIQAPPLRIFVIILQNLPPLYTFACTSLTVSAREENLSERPLS
jgi:hypothetical protein